ncbi:hypothetical protein [Microseira wollei]|uniref:hypothetical protein n=1 Tax=Microseira wollei TaxID=467598 RepID=UPI001CFE281B|nr:hypothetical protein [Microseira wollei]
MTVFFPWVRRNIVGTRGSKFLATFPHLWGMGQFTAVPYPRYASGIFGLIFGKMLSSLVWRHFWGTAFQHLWGMGQFTAVPYPRYASRIFGLIFAKMLSSLG